MVQGILILITLLLVVWLLASIESYINGPSSSSPNRKPASAGFWIPIYSDDNDLPPGEWYKKPDDDPCTIRVRYKKPPGANHMIERDVKVAGISQPIYNANALAFIEAKGCKLTLKRDPTNKYDKNAIMITAHWECGGGSDSGQIGWVPREIAADLAGYDPIYASLRVIFAPGSGRSLGLRIDIWR